MVNPSRYLKLGRRTFTNDRGAQVRGAFNTANARLCAISESLARSIEDPRVELTLGQLRALERAELVGSSDTGVAFGARLEQAAADERVRKFVLLPTPACNMGCDYCGQLHSGRSLKQGYADIVVPRISSVIESPETTEVHVNWFGGEPLLAMKEILLIAETLRPLAEKNAVIYRSQVTTNGSLFSPDLLEQLIVRAGVTRIDVTVDGPKDIHDASRKMKNGKSTYETILSNLQWLMNQTWSASCQIAIRTNVTEESIPHVEELLNDLADRGLTGARGPMLQIAPVHQWGDGLEARQLAIDKFAAAEIRWLALCADRDLNYFALPQLAPDPCSAGRLGTETIDHEGHLFDCVEYPLTPRSRVLLSIGRRPPEGATLRPESDLTSSMPWREPSEGPQCQSCDLFPVCGGACALSRAKGQAHCPSMRHNFPERIDAALHRHLLTAARQTQS